MIVQAVQLIFNPANKILMLLHADNIVTRNLLKPQDEDQDWHFPTNPSYR